MDPLEAALQFSKSYSSSRPTVTAESELDKEVKELLLKELQQGEKDELSANFWTNWLLERSKKNPNRYKHFGANPNLLASALTGDIQAKGIAEDRLVVLNELVKLITQSPDLANSLEIFDTAYAKHTGDGGVHNPFIRELYAAGLGVDLGSLSPAEVEAFDEQITKLLEGEKHSDGKTYTLKDIAKNKRFLVDAHKLINGRRDKLNEIVGDFDYSKLGWGGKVADFNYAGHELAVGLGSGLVVNSILSRFTGLRDFAKHADALGVDEALLRSSRVSQYMTSKAGSGNLTRFIRSFNRSSKFSLFT